MANTIDLRLIFPIQFTPASVPQGNQRVELLLDLPAASTRREPIRRLAPDSSPTVGGEWHIAFAGKATVSMRLDSGRLLALESREVKMEFEIGVADTIPFTPTGSQTTPLLYGSIVIDRQDFPFLNTSLPFRRILANCWPTGKLDEIEQFRFEPSGFYLVGKTPQDLIELDLASRTSIPTSWALRVPQPNPGAEPGTPVPLNPRRWVLTNEAFHKDDQPLLNAELFIRTVAQQFHGFSLQPDQNRDRRLVDSVTSNPEPDATVDILEVNSNRLTWKANGIGTRIVIGGLEAGEAQFDPQELSGEIHFESGSWHHHHTTFGSAAQFQPTEKHVELELERDADQAQERVELKFPDEEIMAANVPAVATARSTASDGPLGETLAATKRTWMCLQEGWLGIDTDRTSASLAPGSTKAGPLGLIELDQLMRSLILNPSNTERGFSVNLLPVESRHIALSLNGNGRKIQRLRISEPVVLLTTPPVFYSEPSVGESDRATAALKSPLWVPSLAARLEQNSLDAPAPDNDQVRKVEEGVTGVPPVGFGILRNLGNKKAAILP